MVEPRSDRFDGYVGSTHHSCLLYLGEKMREVFPGEVTFQLKLKRILGLSQGVAIIVLAWEKKKHIKANITKSLPRS